MNVIVLNPNWENVIKNCFLEIERVENILKSMEKPVMLRCFYCKKCENCGNSKTIGKNLLRKVSGRIIKNQLYEMFLILIIAIKTPNLKCFHSDMMKMVNFFHMNKNLTDIRYQREALGCYCINIAQLKIHILLMQ